MLAESKLLKSECWGMDKSNKTVLEYAVEGAIRLNVVDELLKIPQLEDQRWTSNVAIAAMRNTACSEELMEALFGSISFGDMERTLLDPSEELLVEAVKYPYHNPSLVQGVLKHNKVTSRVLLAAATWQNPHSVPWELRREVWELLLNSVAINNFINWDELILAVIEAENVELLNYLRRREKPPLVSLEMLKAAASSTWHQRDLFRALLVGPGCQQQVTEDVLLAVLDNEETNTSLIRNPSCVFGTYWDKLSDIEVTVEMLIALAKNPDGGADLLETLKERNVTFRDYIAAYADVVEIAVATCNHPLLRSLFNISNLVEGSVFCITETMEYIFKRAPSLWPLGRIMNRYKAVARPGTDSFELVRTQDYWDEQLAEVLKVALDAITREDDDCKWVITQGWLDEAAEFVGPCTMTFLLERSNLPVSEDMLRGAVANIVFGTDVLQLLVKREANDRVWAMLQMDEDLDILKILVQQGSRRMVLLALNGMFTRGSNEELMWLSKVSKHAAANPDIDVVSLVFGRIGKIDCSASLEAAAANSDAALAYLLRLLPMSPGVEISGKVLLNVAKHCRNTNTLRRVLDMRPIHARLDRQSIELERLILAAIANRHGIDMALYVLTHFPEIKLTTSMLYKAASNRRVAPEMLRVLFNHCSDATLQKLITEDVLIAAAKNPTEAPQALHVLLAEPGVPALVSSTVWKVIKVESPTGGESQRVVRDFCELYRLYNGKEKHEIEQDRVKESLIAMMESDTLKEGPGGG